MAAPKIQVMLSSRCVDAIQLNGNASNFSAVRAKLKEELESTEIFDEMLFEVWTNEPAPAAAATADAWEHCMDQIARADIVIAIYNGNAGWTNHSGDIGICHAELEHAMNSAPGKVRGIAVTFDKKAKAQPKDVRFREYWDRLSLFRGTEAKDGNEIISEVKKALFDAVVEMVGLGVREARKGKFYTGAALDWSRLDFVTRGLKIRDTLLSILEEDYGTKRKDDWVIVPLNKKKVMVICHGLPSSFTISQARELVGQPFLKDHLSIQDAPKNADGPVHLIGCHKTITESQAQKCLGFPDATLVTAPFGVYAADPVQKIQMIFIANCRDETTTRHGVQRLMEWLKQTRETDFLRERAASRAKIAKAIWNEQNV